MNYFVTGITGNVGSSIVRRLLRIEGACIWALIRADSEEHARERLHGLFGLWHLSDAEAADAASRVHPLRGDMGSPAFGLADSDWSAVMTNCDHLVHAAGVVRMNLPIEEARMHAVGSARNLIALAEAIAATDKSVSVAFVSTVGVAGKRREPLLDDWVIEPREFHNTYEQSKAEAEDLLRDWNRGERIQLSVHRPSMVVGASDGSVLRHQIFYYLCEFLSGRHTKGLQPTLNDARLDTVPVDYVAQAVCWAVQHTESDGRIFNLCSGSDREIALRDLQHLTREALAQQGTPLPRIRELPAAVFLGLTKIATALSAPEARRRLATLPVLIDYLRVPQVFDGRSTRSYLGEKAGISQPEPLAYLPQEIDRLYRV